ncbi:MAG TPA: complex I NDUFA9 subunit family protein [Nitrospirota bacterium]|nr:complex I NDUFA9 subunit family protein [Nitrospirota bacterium]
MILVTGGTGFVGGHLIRRLRQEGLLVRTLARHPDRAQPLKDLGVEVVAGDISEKVSLEKAAEGIERVIHLVGIIQETPGVTFRDVHVEGTRNIIEAARKAGVRHFFHQSALGTRPGAKSEYHRTKWEAEELVRQSGIPHTILRPSLIYGLGDGFTIRLSKMLKLAPVMPVIGSGRFRIQPIYIDDVVSCMIKAVTGDAFLNEIYEIGGPDQLTYEEVVKAIAEAMGIKRLAVHVPLFFMKPMARALETMLSNPPLTTDQLIMLQEDNVCSMRDIRDAFGIQPLAFREGLRKFIRPVSS